MINVHLGEKIEKSILAPANPQEKIFNEKQNYRKKDIELDIKFGFDRKKKRHHHTDSTESSSEKTNNEPSEKYDNDDDVATSPVVNPQPDPKNIESEELEQELGARNMSRPNTYRQLSLLLSCVTLLKNNLVFIECYFKFGGGYFMIPYFILLFVLAVPVAIFELSLAQFTSLPMFGMFSRMAPILGGIPYMIIFIRLVYTIFIVFDPRFFMFMFTALNSVLKSAYGWTHCRFFEGIACHDPTILCGVNEYQINGQCRTINSYDFLANQKDLVILSHLAKRESRTLSLTPTQIYSDLLSFDIPNGILCSLIFLAISGYISYRGPRYFAACASFFVFLPVIGLIPAMIIIYYDVGTRKQSLFSQLVEHNSVQKIFEFNTWIQAARICVKTLYIGDGTLLTLGSMADFRHNFVKDAFLLASTGALYRIILCITLLPIIYVGHSIINPFDRTLSTDDGLLQFRSVDYFFSALPSYQIPAFDMQTTFLIYALLYFTINIAFIAYQVITFEMLIGWAHHMFPQLLYFKQKTVRLCVILASGSLLLVAYSLLLTKRAEKIGYSLDASLDKFAMGLMSTVVSVELFAVGYIYGFERLLINALTMVKHHKKTYRIIDKCRVFLYIMWTVVLPIMCFMTVHRVLSEYFELYDMKMFVYVFISTFPFIYALRKIIQSVIAREPISWLGQTSKWEPANVGHARDVEHEERAAAVVH